MLPDGTSKTYKSSPFTITDLTEKGTYSVVISHRFKGDTEWGTKTTTLTIGAFEGEVKLDIASSAESGDITITQIPEGFTRVELIKEETGRVVASASLDGNTASYTFKASEVFTAFDLGSFKAKAMSSDTTVISKTIQYASPLVNVKENPGRQHYAFTFDVAEGVTSSDAAIDIDGATAEFTVSGSKGIIKLSGLESLTDYNTTVTISGIDIPLTFTTESFAGYYRWTAPEEDKERTFTIHITEDNEDSPRYKYYIYAIDEENKHRVCPLIDKDVPTGGIGPIDFTVPGDYISENEAYKWNYNHWATKSAPIKNWTILKVTNYGDYVLTEVKTASILPATTATSFDLIEDESRIPRVNFRNEGQGLAAIGMYTNKNHVNEGVDKWTFPMTYLGTSL